MRHLIAQEDRLDDFLLSSAGIGAPQIGQSPDPRALTAAAAQGIKLGGIRSRRLERSDFSTFDLLLAMDRADRDALLALTPPAARQRVHLLLDFSSWIGERDIPDPSDGTADAFENTLDLIQLAVRGLLEVIDQVDGEWAVPEAARARLKVSSAM